MHDKAYASDDLHLPVGGFFRYRQSGERHAFDGHLIRYAACLRYWLI